MRGRRGNIPPPTYQQARTSLPRRGSEPLGPQPQVASSDCLLNDGDRSLISPEMDQATDESIMLLNQTALAIFGVYSQGAQNSSGGTSYSGW